MYLKLIQDTNLFSHFVKIFKVFNRLTFLLRFPSL